MKKLLVLLTALLLLVLGACGNSEVSTGGDGNSTEKKEETTEQVENDEPKEETGKTVDASAQSVEAAGMKVGLGEIKIADDKISVGINLENTTDGALSFYPDQGSAVIGDMQLSANMFMTSGSVGGDVQGGVKQEGVIEFLPPEGKTIDTEAITEIKLVFGDVATEDFMTVKPVEFTVPVK
ncbi:hypothetical protein [Metabacillus sediminilitoris]|uniref:DUF4352 domain-containing protein n=1 Tax=Metabacillus sediminilitoris TaxID=2567941 RepID=A0A4S4BHJ0_9BACI|nr:hypothetical protein [Metabacillus sediminilitoris]QGQ46627.1 hypothetical protein GMB29_16220 [Metabacillus sediminilitoris]THF74027.1 hypothetical protein E6W99_25885 [Metabacillus sediminilitoris]